MNTFDVRNLIIKYFAGRMKKHMSLRSSVVVIAIILWNTKICGGYYFHLAKKKKKKTKDSFDSTVFIYHVSCLRVNTFVLKVNSLNTSARLFPPRLALLKKN